MTLGERLRKLRGAATREVAGERLGIHPSTLQNYEADKRVPDANVIVAICEKFGCTERWLLTGKGPMRAPDLNIDEIIEILNDEPTLNYASSIQPLDVGVVPIPLFDVRAGAGAQQIASNEHPSKQIYLPLEVFALRGIRPTGCGVLLASGSSMEPTISDGDMILYEPAPSHHVDGIFVIARDGGVLVKRLQWRSDGMLSLISDNKAYDPELLPRDDADDIRLIGRVRMVFKSV